MEEKVGTYTILNLKSLKSLHLKRLVCYMSYIEIILKIVGLLVGSLSDIYISYIFIVYLISSSTHPLFLAYHFGDFGFDFHIIMMCTH